MLKRTSILCGAGLLLSVGAANADFLYNNGTTINVEGGYGRLFTPNTNLNSAGGSHQLWGLDYNVGLGYKWSLQQGFFFGLEGDYLYNGSSTYNGSGATNDTGSVTVNSQAYAGLASLTYFMTNNWNIFAKAGYAYVQNQHDYNGTVTATGSGGNDYTLNNDHTVTSWQPMAVVGVGYAIPLSDNIGLDIYTDITWINGGSQDNFNFVNANNYVSNSPQTAEVVAAKIGAALIF